MKDRWLQLKHRTRKFVESLTTPEHRGNVVLKSRSQQMAEAAPAIALVLAPYLLPTNAAAYGEQIVNAGISLYTWARGAGAVAVLLGLCWGGIAMMKGKRGDDAWEHPLQVCKGGLVMFLAPSVLQLLQGVAGAMGTINTSGQ